MDWADSMDGNDLEFLVGCRNCEATFTITFKNKTAHIGEYAMAVEQKLNEPCPNCKAKKLVLIDDTKPIKSKVKGGSK